MDMPDETVKCGMPLILLMLLDMAVNEGHMTLEDAIVSLQSLTNPRTKQA